MKHAGICDDSETLSIVYLAVERKQFERVECQRRAKSPCKVSSGSQSCRLKFVTITVTTPVTSHRDEEVRGEIFHRPPSFDSLAKLITNTASTSNL